MRGWEQIMELGLRMGRIYQKKIHVHGYKSFDRWLYQFYLIHEGKCRYCEWQAEQ